MEVQLTKQIESVLIDADLAETEWVSRAQIFFGSEKVQIIESAPFPETKGTLSAKEYDRSKRVLHLTKHKGAFFKRCPGAKPGLSCCNYFVLNLGLQCNMNCSYCYLQSYINSPTLQIYTNIDDAISELRAMATEFPAHFYRVGTGEVTDSLGLDDFTLFSRKLIPFFNEFKSWTLEFKTKSSKVEQFLDVDHAGNTIVSWSLNPENVIAKEEFGTASLESRLAAARKCRDNKFPVAFHIDPMIWHEDWKESYSLLAGQIASQFLPGEVRWITVGALRFQPGQKAIMRERFGMDSLVTSAEVFPSQEGKLRYDSALRNEMFQFLVGRFKELSPDWKLSLCMETKESWVTTMASTARQIPEIKNLFDPLPKAKGLRLPETIGQTPSTGV
ncbi:MAG: radical SAM protein [Bdellovibrionales bacterium]|nr:radical SAM protein [Bdellovibrionales bacterium]